MVIRLKIFIILFLLIQVALTDLIITECDSESSSNGIEKSENKEIDSEDKSEFVLFCSSYFIANTPITLNNNYKKYLLEDCQFSYKKYLMPPEQV